MTAIGPELKDEVRNAAFEAAFEFGRSASNSRLTVREFEQAFRAGFIRQASERMKKSGVEPTKAHLALDCGLTRNVVEQAMADLAEFDREKSRESFDENGIFEGLSLLVSLWSSDPRFTQVYGVPRDLLIRRASGDSAALEDAAAIALPAVPLEQVLQELTARGLISIDRNGGMAKLISDVIPIQDFEARAAVRFSRLTAGLMRTLRINYERRMEGSNARRMWEKSFWTDRPIIRDRTSEFLSLADENVRKWLVKLESNQRTYAASNDQKARQYCIAVFAITSVDEFAKDEASERPLLHSLMTTTPIKDDAAREFIYDVNESASMWLNALDAEQHDVVAAPGQPSASIEICAFMFDVAGSKGDPMSKAIDLVQPRVARR